MRWLPKWRDLSLRAKCLLLISFPAAATVLMFGVANILAVRGSEAGDRVSRALETGATIQRLRAAENESSADMRAYFITAQESFATEASASLAGFDSAEQKLLELTSDNPSQQQLLAQIASLERYRVELIFRGAALFRVGRMPWDQVRATLRAAETDRLRMDDLLKGMEQDNTRRLQLGVSRAEELRTQQGAITGICLFLGLLSGVAMTLLFARGITNRINFLQQNVAQLATGVTPLRLAGQDEIGALSESLIQVGAAAESGGAR